MDVYCTTPASRFFKPVSSTLGKDAPTTAVVTNNFKFYDDAISQDNLDQGRSYVRSSLIAVGAGARLLSSTF